LNRELEPGRHHPDDRVRTAIEHQHAPDRIFRPVKMALPKAVADHDFQAARPAAGLFVRAREAAAEERLCPEHIEKFAAHP
jgi:hypothetical protein